MNKVGAGSYYRWVACVFLCLGVAGCAGMDGYTNASLYPSGLSSVYVEMFENESFWRGVEYDLSDALSKRIEAETPYKVVSDRDRADSVISGQIVSVDQTVLSIEREMGTALEKEVELRVIVTWKNLTTGELLVESRSVGASGSYSALQSQSFKYASRIATNNLASRIVELMETQW